MARKVRYLRLQLRIVGAVAVLVFNVGRIYGIMAFGLGFTDLHIHSICTVRNRIDGFYGINKIEFKMKRLIVNFVVCGLKLLHFGTKMRQDLIYL